MAEQQVAPVPAGAGDEQIEGFGTPGDSALGAYPLDTMLIRTDSRTIHDVLRRIDRDEFIMNPDFQRDFIWPADKQSKLIESVLMRIPLPVFYIAENEDGRLVVVDGLQRLSTFRNFVNGDLRLRLPEQPSLDGKRFIELERRLQNRIEDSNLILYVIDSKAPERARLDIFERVNGGAPLTRQQMRNCLYMGQGTLFLKQEADRPLFLEATGGSLNPGRMADREFVNRFCGFRLFALEDYRGDMDAFLSDTLKRMNSLDSEKLADLSDKLQRGLNNNFKIFGRHAFRKHIEEQSRRGSLNASLWDVMSTGLADYDWPMVERKKDQIRARFYRLLQDGDFSNAITLGTNQTRRVRLRFEMSRSMFKEVFGD